MRNENAALTFRSLQVPSKDLYNSDDLAEIVSRLALSSCTDNEFKLDGGILKVSRIMRDPQMDDMVGGCKSVHLRVLGDWNARQRR